MILRLLETGLASAAFNMGLDEAVLGRVASGHSAPTLRLYGWTPSAVSVGYFQSLSDEVDLDACAATNVDAVRRVTGGGAVFHDAEITYSIVVPEGHELAPADILESYRKICAGVVEGCAQLGVSAEFAPINDIVAGGKKVSGNAQTRKRGCLLQHGTVLLSVDVERMFRLLKVPAEKLRGKLIDDVKQRVTSLSDLMGRPVSFEEAAKALTLGFSRAFGAELRRESPTETELSDAETLAREKYGQPTWNRLR